MSANSEATECTEEQPGRPVDTPFIEWVHQMSKDSGGKCVNDVQYEASKKYQRVVSSWKRVKEDRGKRYTGCEFTNYEIKHAGQQQVVDQLKAYARNSEAEIAAGRNVILFGPKGSGKDHLLMATARDCAYWSGAIVRWVNGVDLAEEFICDATGKPSKLDRFWSLDGSSIESCDILWISDPLPPTGALTEFQQAAYLKLIDKRYNELKPTWVTLNVASAAEAEARMGAQTVDRLRHGALKCFCNWPSYRAGE